MLEGESQSLWAVIRLSLQQQFGYWLSLVHPSQVAAAAKRVDAVTLKVLQEVAGFKVPQIGDELPYTCPMGQEVPHLEGRSFQSILTGLPVKYGGLGLRSQLEQSPAAWVGALEQALPFFQGRRECVLPWQSCLAVRKTTSTGGNLYWSQDYLQARSCVWPGPPCREEDRKWQTI